MPDTSDIWHIKATVVVNAPHGTSAEDVAFGVLYPSLTDVQVETIDFEMKDLELVKEDI